jgi:hypothetical protein
MEKQNVQTNKRPVFLTVLCILTFIATGLGLLFGIIGLFAAGAIESIAAYLPMGTDSGLLKSIIMLVLIGASLYGAIQMWNLKKLGFYIYSAANVVMLIIGFSIFSLVITAGFIVMYYLNLKAMK